MSCYLSVYIFCLFVPKTKVVERKEKGVRNQFRFLAIHSTFVVVVVVLVVVVALTKTSSNI